MKEDYFQIHISKVQRTEEEIENEPNLLGQMNFYHKGFILMEVQPGLPEPVSMLHAGIEEGTTALLEAVDLTAAWLTLTSHLYHMTQKVIFKEMIFNLFMKLGKESGVTEDSGRDLTEKCLQLHQLPDWAELEKTELPFTSWTRNGGDA